MITFHLIYLQQQNIHLLTILTKLNRSSYDNQAIFYRVAADATGIQRQRDDGTTDGVAHRRGCANR